MLDRVFPLDIILAGAVIAIVGYMVSNASNSDYVPHAAVVNVPVTVPPAAPDDPVTLIPGRLNLPDPQSPLPDMSIQYSSVHNNTARLIDMVSVECGFFASGVLLSSEIGHVMYLAPNGDGFASVFGRGGIPDRVQCRATVPEIEQCKLAPDRCRH